MTLRVGLVGAGMISEFHLKAWAKARGAELVALCDTDPARARDRGAAFGIAAVHDDMDAMIAAERLDAVDIATPLETHVALVRRAAAAGVAVLCQKPLAPSLAEARALVGETAGRARLMVHENWRFRPYYRQVAAWLREGRIGRPAQVAMSALSSGLLPGPDGRRPALEREPSLRRSRHLVVGTLLVHHLDVLRFLLGPLGLRTARLRREIAEVEADTLATLFLETADGVPVVLTGNMAAAGCPTYISDGLELFGSRGSVALRDGRLVLTDGEGGGATLSWEQPVAYQAAFDGAIQHFVDALAAGTAFETSGEDNLATLGLVQEVLDRFPLAAAGP